MSHYVIVTAADSASEPTFAALGGRTISPRMGIVPWCGTAEQLRHRVARSIPCVGLIASLDGDCIIGTS